MALRFGTPYFDKERKRPDMEEMWSEGANSDGDRHGGSTDEPEGMEHTDRSWKSSLSPYKLFFITRKLPFKSFVRSRDFAIRHAGSTATGTFPGMLAG